MYERERTLVNGDVSEAVTRGDEIPLDVTVVLFEQTGEQLTDADLG